MKTRRTPNRMLNMAYGNLMIRSPAADPEAIRDTAEVAFTGEAVAADPADPEVVDPEAADPTGPAMANGMGKILRKKIRMPMPRLMMKCTSHAFCSASQIRIGIFLFRRLAGRWSLT